MRIIVLRGFRYALLALLLLIIIDFLLVISWGVFAFPLYALAFVGITTISGLILPVLMRILALMLALVIWPTAFCLRALRARCA